MSTRYTRISMVEFENPEAIQTEARLVRDVIYFDGYLEFAASKSYYSKIER